MRDSEHNFQSISMSDFSLQGCSCWCQGELRLSPFLWLNETYNPLISYQVLFLPEASDYVASSAEESFALAQSADCGEFISALQNSAKREDMHINVGIHEMASEHRLKNSLVWIDNKGTVTQNYQKVHLFDVNIKGGPILKEST